MTENLPAGPTRQALAVKDRSQPGRVTGKLKTAIDRMVWHGDKRADAAIAAGLSDHGLRAALKKQHVKGYWNAELTALREGERPRNVHRLAELRDQDENRNAAVAAIKTLEQLTDEGVAAGRHEQRTPGMVVVIVGGPSAPTPSKTIEAPFRVAAPVDVRESAAPVFRHPFER